MDLLEQMKERKKIRDSEYASRNRPLKSRGGIFPLADEDGSVLCPQINRRAPQNAINVFEERFSNDLISLEESLIALNKIYKRNPECSENEGDFVKPKDFVTTTENIRKLQILLTNSTNILPDFKIKNNQSRIDDLTKVCEAIRKQSYPKKKFVFKGRKKDTTASSSKSEQNEDKQKQETKEEQNTKFKKNDVGEDVKIIEIDFPVWDEKLAKATIEPPKNICINTIENIKNEYIKYDEKMLDNKALTLCNLTNCFIDLQGRISSLRISDIVDCVILTGPINFSVYAEKCRSTTFAFTCQQLRLHESVDCRVFLNVSSSAIIEQCSKISFGKYNYDYPELKTDYKRIGFDRTENNYKQIVDFNWLSPASPSPNWTIIQSDCEEDWNKLRKEFQAKIGRTETSKE